MGNLWVHRILLFHLTFDDNIGREYKPLKSRRAELPGSIALGEVLPQFRGLTQAEVVAIAQNQMI